MPTDLFPAASALLAGLPERQGFGDASLIRLRPGSIDLGGGNPDPGVLPVGLYRDAARALMQDDAAFAPTLRYPAAAGIASLRERLAAQEGVDTDRIIVTSGATHGLALSVLGTLEAGDTIVVDDPVYPLFLRVLDLVGPDVVPVSVGPDGIDVEQLEDRLRGGLRPKALFTVPTFHNPSGGTLSESKAARLVELAEHYGFTVFADDPYKELAFPGVTAPDRGRFAASDHVIQVNTFSKTLGPGLRLGWNVVPSASSHGYVKLRNRLDGQASALLQQIVVRILESPDYRSSVATAGAVYEQKARVLTDALDRLIGVALEYERPTGGFFLWARFANRDVDFGRLFDVAQELGVSYQRGEWFEVGRTEAARGAIRLSFSEPDPSALRLGAERLAEALRIVGG